jgi:hypothetical protein
MHGGASGPKNMDHVVALCKPLDKLDPITLQSMAIKKPIFQRD